MAVPRSPHVAFNTSPLQVLNPPALTRPPRAARFITSRLEVLNPPRPRSDSTDAGFPLTSTLGLRLLGAPVFTGRPGGKGIGRCSYLPRVIFRSWILIICRLGLSEAQSSISMMTAKHCMHERVLGPMGLRTGFSPNATKTLKALSVGTGPTLWGPGALGRLQLNRYRHGG